MTESRSASGKRQLRWCFAVRRQT